MASKTLTFQTELCEIAYKYGTDKCPQIGHLYTPFYFELLKDKRDSVRKVVEIGIGTPKYMHYESTHYVTGASLYMWRDFFPHAMVYGADVLPESLIEDERIKTFFCDETKKEDVERLIGEVGGDIDLFVDDALHVKELQIALCKMVMPMVKRDVIYIIEDVGFPNTITAALSEYDCLVKELNYTAKTSGPKNRVIVVRNKAK